MSNREVIKPHYNISPIALVLGMVIGMILMLVILTLIYSTRTLIFEICPTKNKVCLAKDYYNNPSEAANNGEDPTKNLFVKDDKLHFEKILKSRDCNPTSNPVNVINYPRFCEFTIPGVTGTYIGRNNHYGSDTYNIPSEKGGSYQVVTYPHCVPKDEKQATSGKPLIMWNKD